MTTKQRKAGGQGYAPAAGSACDWCNRKVGTHEFVSDIGDRFLRRNAHKDGKGNTCLHSFAIVAELPNTNMRLEERSAAE